MMLHSWGRRRLPILRTVQDYFWRAWQGQTQYVWTGQTIESGLRCWAQHLTAIWVGRATTSPLYSYVRGSYQTDWHATFHVHLFGDPGKTHTHSRLTRISFNAHKIHFGILSTPTFSFLHQKFLFNQKQHAALLSCCLQVGQKAYGKIKEKSWQTTSYCKEQD